MISGEIILPSAILRPFVHHYWVMRTCDTSLSQIIMPVGSLKWMFHRKRPFDVDGVENTNLKASVVGLYEKAIRISNPDDVEMITVFFFPYAARIVMNIPCDQFFNSNVDIDSLEDPELKELKSKVLEAETAEKSIQMIEDLILKRLIRNQGAPYIKPLSKVFELMNSAPEMRVKKLAEAACLSERQFRRVFAENVGMTPKQLQRIQRFHLATNELLYSREDALEQILCKYGYTDHSHFNREFHEIVGLSPTEYLSFLRNVRKAGTMTILRSYYDSSR